MMQRHALNHPLTRTWLLLALGAIGLSALFATLLVVSRTPLLQQLFGTATLFHTILVLHVNFSVLVWLLAFGAALWSLTMPRLHPLLDPLAFGLVITGALLLSLSPLLTPPPQAIMSNYIPILLSPAFLTGLCAFAAGIGLYALRRLTTPGDPLARLSALSLLVALLVFAITAWRMPLPIDSAPAFEALFWGGGHMLQFTYLLLLIGAWQRLHSATQTPLPRSAPSIVALSLFLCGLLAALWFEPGSAESRAAYTWLMRLGTPLLLLPALRRLWCDDARQPLRWSQLLLLGGLLLGLLIQADNVTVTAHYHATNAAITLAFMALSYRLLEQLQMGTTPARHVRQQLAAYGVGMGLYIAGMALSGLLDVPRKVPLTTTGIEALAMGLMGLGGLVAVTATILFVFRHLQALRPPLMLGTADKEGRGNG